MIDRIFTYESTRLRHRAAPLLLEREAFLTFLYDRGIAIIQLKAIAATLLNIVRLLGLESLRSIQTSEVADAAARWCKDSYRGRGRHSKSPKYFSTVAMRWFQFANVISPMVTVKNESDTLLERFNRHITVDCGRSDYSTRHYLRRATQFLVWAGTRIPSFAEIDIGDVEEYLEHCRERGFRPKTINGIVAALRAFFRYATSDGFNVSKIAPRINYEPVCRYENKPKGPEWRDVRRLLDHGFGSTPSDLRAAAFVALSAIYALRQCEVARLRLCDIDWTAETITVHRGKSRQIQQFPLQFEVGEKILNYLRNGRAKCSCRSLFIAIRPPYRPMNPTVTYAIVAERMRYLNIKSENFGLHALRHSCATKLLREGSPLKDVADFLGHSDMSSVSIYAKFDLKTLEQVASFSLRWLN